MVGRAIGQPELNTLQKGRVNLGGKKDGMVKLNSLNLERTNFKLLILVNNIYLIIT